MSSHRNKFVVLASMASVIAIGISTSKPPVGLHKNLQILPKDISAARLDSIMQTYNVALGVNCKFCHVPMKNNPDSMDYAADTEPMKQEARKMMRLTISLNKTYFYYDTLQRPEYLKVVTCNTCHRGEAFPEQ